MKKWIDKIFKRLGYLPIQKGQFIEIKHELIKLHLVKVDQVYSEYELINSLLPREEFEIIQRRELQHKMFEYLKPALRYTIDDVPGLCAKRLRCYIWIGIKQE